MSSHKAMQASVNIAQDTLCTLKWKLQEQSNYKEEQGLIKKVPNVWVDLF